MESPNSLYNNLNGSSGGGGSGSNGNGGKESLDSSENIVIPSNFLISTKEIIARFPHNKRVGHYLLGRKLGEGSFAKVKEGLHTVTGQKVAIKVIDKKKAKEDAYVSKNMRREGKLLQMIIHPNIIQLYELMETENSYYLVTELCESGDLMDYICARKYLSEAVTRKFIRQIISAVDYLHRIGILHRDLKIENLLLDKNLNIKLIDFGLSNYTKSELCITQCGSPAYAAPELLAHKKYGAKVDVWSIGVNMYAMLTGNLPFTVEPFNIKSLYNKMMKNEMNPIPEHLSKSGEDLLRKLLNPDPVKRISLKDAMEHPWLNEGYSSVLKPFPYPNKPTDEHLNTTIIRYMNTNMDFNLNEVMENIKANKPSSSLSTYYLLLYKVKSMLLKMDPKKDKLKMQTPTSKPVVQKESSIKPQAAVNNTTNNKPLVVNTVSQQPQVVPNAANSPVARVVKTALINNQISTPVSGNNATSNNVNSSIPAAACSTGGYCPPATTTNKTATNRAGQPDVLTKYVNTKPAERTMSPMSNNSNGANNTNHNSSTTTASSSSSSSTNNNTSMTTTGSTLSGAMKNLTQKYKTMHLANSTGGVGGNTLLDEQLTNRTLSPSLPPPPHIITTNSTPAHHRIATAGTNGPATSNHLYYSTSINTKPNSYNALLNSVDLNHTIIMSSSGQGDMTANNLSSLTAKNSEHKSTSSSSSEEPNSVSHAITPPGGSGSGPNHHFVHTMRPIIKTSTLTHRNSLNNGPSSNGAANVGGSTTLTHSNSTKLTHADWTTQMIKLNGKARSDLNDTNNKLSPNSAVIGDSNATVATSANARKSPIVKKIISNGGSSGRTASPVTLPAIDAGRAITPQ